MASQGPGLHPWNISNELHTWVQNWDLRFWPLAVTNNSYKALLLKYYKYSSIKPWEKNSILIFQYLTKWNGNFAPVILQC